MPPAPPPGVLAFLKVLDAKTPKRLDLHLIVDNYRTHKHPW
jgi:hypothetical protein